MKTLKKMVVLAFSLVFSLSLSIQAFALVDGGYGTSCEIWGSSGKTTVTGEWSLYGTPQTAYTGRNQTANDNSIVTMSVMCSSNNYGAWVGARQSLFGYPGYTDPYIREISGYTVSKGDNSTRYYITLTHTTGSLYYADAWVERPSSRSAILSVVATVNLVPVDQISYPYK